MTTTGDRRVGDAFAGLLRTSLRNWSALWLLLVFVILFSITAWGTFNTALTAQIVLSDHVTTALLALAILIPLAGGSFDFSVGALLLLALSITAVMTRDGMAVWQAGVLAIVATTLCGLLSGFIVVKLHVNSFIATLGVGQVATAMAYLLTQNQPVLPNLPYWFTTMTRGELFGISFDVYFLLIVATIMWYVLEHTPVGRSLFAAGGNPEAAKLAGVSVGRLTWASLGFSGAISGLAGVLLLSKVGTYSQEYGPSFLFAAFAAVFFGATQIKGRPNVWGTLIALYVLATAVAGLQLTFFGNEYWITPLFNGLALIIAVALASRKHVGSVYRKLRKGKAPPSDAPSDDIDPTPAVPAAVERGYE